MERIGIIITTFERPKILKKCLYSLTTCWENNFEVVVIDQSSGSFKKQNQLITTSWQVKNFNIGYVEAPFNSGLSYCRNLGVSHLKHDCDYILMASDSFDFNDSIVRLNLLENIMDYYDILGFELDNCTCDWEATIDLEEDSAFVLDFIDKQKDPQYTYNNINVYNCEICRNFFLAKTQVMDNVKYDEQFRLCEHEDWFYRVKQAGYKVGWTNFITASKMTDRPSKYNQYRQNNMQEGRKRLQKKYGIKGWVRYKHLQRAKH